MTLVSRTQQPLYLLMLDRRQVKSSPRQLPVSSKLVSAQNPFALFWIVREYFYPVNPRHPFDYLCLVSPQVPSSFERYTDIYLSTANSTKHAKLDLKIQQTAPVWDVISSALIVTYFRVLQTNDVRCW